MSQIPYYFVSTAVNKTFFAFTMLAFKATRPRVKKCNAIYYILDQFGAVFSTDWWIANNKKRNMIRLPRTANRSNFCDKSKCHISWKGLWTFLKTFVKNNTMKERKFIWLLALPRNKRFLLKFYALENNFKIRHIFVIRKPM